MDTSEFLEGLEGVRRQGLGEWMARCPSHPDRTPSLHVTEADDRTLVNCFAGCETDDIMAAMDLKKADLFVDGKGGGRIIVPKADTFEADYPYLDKDGEVVYVVQRRAGKQFRADRKVAEADRVLYNLPAVLAETEKVYLVEGEKDANTLIEAGHVATTAPFGAKSGWLPQYTNQLEHVKEVIVVADNDTPGIERAHRVVSELTNARAVRPRLGYKDVTELYEGGLRVEGVATLVDLPPEVTVVPLTDDELDGYIDIHDLFKNPPPKPTFLAFPLIVEGRTTAISSFQGWGKSLLGLDLATRLATGKEALGSPEKAPRRVLYLDLEMSAEEFHQRLTNLGWGPEHPQIAALVENLHYYSLPKLPPLDTEAGGHQLIRLVDHYQAEVIVMDTISKAILGKENDVETFTNLFNFSERELKRRNITIIRFDHLGKNLDVGMRGSSAKGDNVDFVWQMDEPVTVKVNNRYRDELNFKTRKVRAGGIPETTKLFRVSHEDGKVEHQYAGDSENAKQVESPVDRALRLLGDDDGE